MKIDVQQITFGPRHHFFGYIGHCNTVPWNESGRYIVCLETESQDRMPGANESARVMLIDAKAGYALQKVAETRAWNPQQGTMLYWNPEAAETQFFFNDRDPETGKVFTVLYDIQRGARVREYRYEDTPVANGGVAQRGGSFMAINYGRLARLRAVTGYPGAFDWTEGIGVPEDDGVFRVDIKTGAIELVCSFRKMVAKLVEIGEAQPEDEFAVFINHTLWNREGDRILFYLRSGPMWGPGDGQHLGKNLNHALTMRPDGSELTCHGYVGGHPEWAAGSKIIANGDQGLRLYDVARAAYVDTIGDEKIFFDCKGDKALSPDAKWLVHGNCVKKEDGEFHEYVVYRLSDGFYLRSPLFSRGAYINGPLRLDPAPCWNREGNQVLAPGLAADGTRQLFLLKVG